MNGYRMGEPHPQSDVDTWTIGQIHCVLGTARGIREAKARAARRRNLTAFRQKHNIPIPDYTPHLYTGVGLPAWFVNSRAKRSVDWINDDGSRVDWQTGSREFKAAAKDAKDKLSSLSKIDRSLASVDKVGHRPDNGSYHLKGQSDTFKSQIKAIENVKDIRTMFDVLPDIIEHMPDI